MLPNDCPKGHKAKVTRCLDTVDGVPIQWVISCWTYKMPYSHSHAVDHLALHGDGEASVTEEWNKLFPIKDADEAKAHKETEE